MQTGVGDNNTALSSNRPRVALHSSQPSQDLQPTQTVTDPTQPQHAAAAAGLGTVGVLQEMPATVRSTFSNINPFLWRFVSICVHIGLP